MIIRLSVKESVVLRHHSPHSVPMRQAGQTGRGLTERTGFMNIHKRTHQPTARARSEANRVDANVLLGRDE